jgi:FkbH-like protein
MNAAAQIGRSTEIKLPSVRIAFLRDYTIETFLPSLKVECARIGLWPETYLNDFDVIEQELLNPSSGLNSFKPEVVVLALRIHKLARRLMMEFGEASKEEIETLAANVIERTRNIINILRQQSSAVVLVHDFEMPDFPPLGFIDSQSTNGLHNVIRRLNLSLVSMVNEFTGAYVVDVDYVASQVGYRNAIDHKYWQIGKAPYTFAFNLALAKEYVKPIRALKGKAKKCLVLDCDNTLWGGIVGEDGINGIKLGNTHPGSSYADFHLAVLDLYHRGVLLALCSKNNESDALEVFISHPDSKLKKEHFVTHRINWQDKATNLREIAAELNIGTDSLVFMDDSEFECNLVRRELPEVLTVHLTGDASSYRSVLQGLGVFDTLTISDEDRKRSSMYRADTERKATLANATSMEEYLASLEMVLTISKATDFAIPRIAQLTQKTNQFNLTTRRYSEDEIRSFASNDCSDVYFAELNDKFDSSGIIAVAIVKRDGQEADIDTFLMSCRVIGRGVEDAMVAHIVGESKEKGVIQIRGHYLPTAKNGQVADFYETLGFFAVGDKAPGTWALEPAEADMQTPSWFKDIITGGESKP